MSVEDTCNEYTAKVNYHNHLIENIDMEMYFHTGDNALEKIEQLKVEAEKLVQYLPSDFIKTAPKFLEWSDEHFDKLEPELSKAMKQMITQEQKIKDFIGMYPYINKKYPAFNVGLVMVTMINNFGKMHNNFVKHGGPLRKGKFKELELLVRGMQKDKPTKKQLNDVEGFEKLKQKYPQFDFDRKELSEVEQKLKEEKLKVNVLGQADIKV